MNKVNQKLWNYVYPIILSLMGVFQLSAAGTHELFLVRDGKAQVTIVVAEKVTPAANLASLELRHAIKEMTGVALPIVKDSEKVKGTKILIGLSKYTEGRHLEVNHYSQIESLIRFDADALLLVGRDASAEDMLAGPRNDFYLPTYINYTKAAKSLSGSEKILIPGDFDHQGSLRATYRFVEKWLNVSYFGPMPHNVYFEKKRSIKVSGSSHYHKRAMGTVIGDLGYHDRKVAFGGKLNATGHQRALFERRSRSGGIPWHINHSFGYLQYKKRFLDEKSPEYTVEILGTRADGKRSRQFCFTEKKFIDVFSKDAKDYFDNSERMKKILGKTNAVSTLMKHKSDVFAVVPFDGGDYCECETCLSQFPGRPDQSVDFNSGEYSNRVFGLVNKMAKNIQKSHPDKFIGALAYEAYFWPPDFDLEKNVAVTPCVHTKYWHEPSVRSNELKNYKKWANMKRKGELGRLYLWTYDFIVKYDFHYGKERGKYIKMFLKDGVEGVFQCGGPDMVAQYLTTQLYEYPDSKIEDLYKDLFDKYFGRASREMEAFYDALCEITTNLDKTPLSPNGNLLHVSDRGRFYMYTAKNIARLRKLIDASKIKATGADLERVLHWEMAYVLKRENELGKYVKKVTKAPENPAPGYLFHVNCFVDRYWKTRGGNHGVLETSNVRESGSKYTGSKQARLVRPGTRWGGNYLGDQYGRAFFFDLGGLVELDDICIWNYNDNEDNRGWGMRNIEILYAADPNDLTDEGWSRLKLLELPKARQPLKLDKGVDPIYGPEAEVKCGKVKTRYVMIRTVGKLGSANWDSLKVKRLKTGLGHVRFYGTRLAFPAPVFELNRGVLSLTTSNFAKHVVYYTLDGSPVTETSPRYSEPLTVKYTDKSKSILVRAKVFALDKDIQSSEESQKRLDYNAVHAYREIARGRQVSAVLSKSEEIQPVKGKKFSRLNRAIDGRNHTMADLPGGSKQHDYLIHLNKTSTVNELWLKYPQSRSYTIQLSVDGKTWEEVVKVDKKVENPSGIYYTFKSTPARYVRIKYVHKIMEFKLFKNK